MSAQPPRSAVAAFAADPSSSSHARRFVRDSLLRMGVTQSIIESAELIASELVTNAVLHAHAGPVITVQVHDNLLRLEVEDNSELFPLLRQYGSNAVTGRGLDMVEGAATRWGVETTQNGKTVWAEFAFEEHVENLGKQMSDAASQMLSGQKHNRRSTDDYEVVFLAVPIDLYLLVEQHHEALLREFELLEIGMTQHETSAIPAAVFELVKVVNPVLSSRFADLRPQVADARAAGQSTCDLHGPANQQLLEWTQTFERFMEEADGLSRAGLLLTEPTPPGGAELRRWMIDEINRQFVDRLVPRPAPSFKS